MKRYISLAVFVIAAIVTSMASGQSVQNDEQSLRLLVKSFADARNAHDGERAGAMYAEDGEWIGTMGQRVKGRSALGRLWGNLPGEVQRTVRSVDFIGAHIAVVRVDTRYEASSGLHHEAFVFVKQDGFWKIRDHQSIE